MNRKRLFFWLKIIIIVYCGIGIVLYYLQEKFLFHPVRLPASGRSPNNRRRFLLNFP